MVNKNIYNNPLLVLMPLHYLTEQCTDNGNCFFPVCTDDNVIEIIPVQTDP